MKIILSTPILFWPNFVKFQQRIFYLLKKNHFNMELLVLTIATFKVSFSILRSVVNNSCPVFHPGGFIDTNFVDREFTQANKPWLDNPYVNIDPESEGLCFYSNKNNGHQAGPKYTRDQLLNLNKRTHYIPQALILCLSEMGIRKCCPCKVKKYKRGKRSGRRKQRKIKIIQNIFPFTTSCTK